MAKAMKDQVRSKVKKLLIDKKQFLQDEDKEERQDLPVTEAIVDEEPTIDVQSIALANAQRNIALLKAQGKQLETSANWWNNLNNALTLAIGSFAVGATMPAIVKLEKFKDAVAYALTKSTQFKRITVEAINRSTPELKAVTSRAESMTLPIAVVAALGVGGIFAFRKYLNNRKNIQMARKLATDKAFMAHVETIIRESGMDSMRNSKDGIKAVHELEQAELKGAPYMKGR